MENVPEKLKLSLSDHLSIWVGHTIGKLYWVLFGWWIDAPIARKHEREFAREIREGLPFLFEKHSAEIVPNEGVRFPPPFDYALVTIAVGHLLIRFVRGRGELRIDVAARGKIQNWRDWKDLKTIRMVLDKSENSERPFRLRNLSDAERLLRIELPRLQEATSDDQWDLVKRKANALFPPLLRIR